MISRFNQSNLKRKIIIALAFNKLTTTFKNSMIVK